jgi:hypothetical protein
MVAPLQNLRTRHRQVAWMELLGYGRKEIAAKLDMDPVRVCQIQREPLYQGYLNQLIGDMEDQVVDVRKRIQQAAGPAIEKVINLIHSEDDKLALKAAQDVLDRAGYAPVKQTVMKEETTRIERGEIVEVQQRWRAAFESGVVVDGKSASNEPIDVPAPTSTE